MKYLNDKDASAVLGALQAGLKFTNDILSPIAVRDCISSAIRLMEANDSTQQPPSADDVEWIVNDMGELGVRVHGRCFFCYKGESLVYDGHHDGGEPILHRNVGKREFGEVIYPAAWQAAGRCEPRYTQGLEYVPGLSFGSPDDPKHKWLPLPVEVQP